MRKTFLLLVLGLAGISACAQSDSPGDFSFAFQLGTNWPQQKLGTRADNGWTSSFDFTYNLSKKFHLRTELGYSDNHIYLPANWLGASGSQYNWNITENLVFHLNEGPVCVYLIGGLGGYNTHLTLDRPVMIPGGGWWYGWWYPVYGEATVASRNTTKLGANAGIGVIFKSGGQASFFMEARYTQIQTNTTIDYIPFTLGVRF